MQIAQELSGYSLGGADLLRRAMGKKIKEEMDKQRALFVDGAVARSVPAQKASDIFDQVNKFAGYGFNKSHAAAYALIAFQTAYLKANYPVEFIAGSMTLDLNNTDKLNVFRQELESQKIKLLTPDINKSNVAFAVEVLEGGERAIRYALAAIKNVGEAAMESVIREREANGPYKDLFDFANRLDTKVVNKRQMENLVRSGAFDSLNNNRHQVHSGIEQLLNHASMASKDRNADQIGMFGADDAAVVAAAKLPERPEWPLMDRLKHEFDALGFYLSAHPLDAYGKTLKRLKALTYNQIIEAGESKPVHIAGTIIGKKVKTSKKGNKFAFVDMSDATGAFEVTLFSDQLNAAEGLLEVGQSIFIKGSATFEGESVRFIANRIESLDEVVARSSSGLKVFVDSEDPLPMIKEMLEREGKGRGEVIVTARLSLTKEADLKLEKQYAITPQLLQAVKAIPGIVDVQET